MKRQKDKFSWDLHWENEYTSQRGLLGDVNSLKAEDDQLQLSPNNTISIHYRKKRLWKFLKLSPKGKCFHIRSTNSLRKYIEMSLEIGTNLRFMKKTDKFSLEGKFCSLYQNSSSNGLTFQNNEDTSDDFDALQTSIGLLQTEGNNTGDLFFLLLL